MLLAERFGGEDATAQVGEDELDLRGIELLFLLGDRAAAAGAGAASLRSVTASGLPEVRTGEAAGAGVAEAAAGVGAGVETGG